MSFPYTTPSGRICCSNPLSVCPKCKAKMLADDPVAAARAEVVPEWFLALSRHSEPAPDPYASEIAKLRAATSTRETRFEDRWKAERFAEVERFEEMEPLVHLSDDDLKDYKAPDPYEAGLRAMREAGR